MERYGLEPRETEKITLPFTILTIGKKYECDQ